LPDREADLLDRCRRGEEAAWRQLVNGHARRVFALIYRLVQRSDQAEDLTQEVFIKVLRGLAGFRGTPDAFKAWLATLARNQAIDHWRKGGADRAQLTVENEILDSLPATDPDPEDAVYQEERARLLREGVRVLPKELRLPLMLRDLDGLGYDEIAQVLDLPLGTIKSRINRARLELARRMAGLRAGEGAP
jgi:RNA polymerase sigma-70 factor, ECF subfamily